MATKQKKGTQKISSAEKRNRTSLERRSVNAYDKKTAKTKIKKLRKLTDVVEAKVALIDTVSSLDKLAKRNTMHKNKVARYKSALAKHVNALANNQEPKA